MRVHVDLQLVLTLQIPDNDLAVYTRQTVRSRWFPFPRPVPCRNEGMSGGRKIWARRGEEVGGEGEDEPGEGRIPRNSRVMTLGGLQRPTRAGPPAARCWYHPCWRPFLAPRQGKCEKGNWAAFSLAWSFRPHALFPVSLTLSSMSSSLRQAALSSSGGMQVCICWVQEITTLLYTCYRGEGLLNACPENGPPLCAPPPVQV